MVSSGPGLLIICFNRPDLLEQVLDRIPADFRGPVFISRDGPREGRPADAPLVEEVEKLIIQRASRLGNLSTAIHSENLGCRVHVQTAIDWFFNNVSEGIILEDDCLPNVEFFDFCVAMLEKWRDIPKIMHVSGDNSFQIPAPADCSYGFTTRPLVWGWATWRRAWVQCDKELFSWQHIRGSAFEAGLWPSRREGKKRRILLDSIFENGKPDTWDAQWLYSIRLMGGLAIMPGRNLVTNIGFRDDATHTRKPNHPRANFPTGSIFPLRHPKTILPTMKAFV